MTKEGWEVKERTRTICDRIGESEGNGRREDTLIEWGAVGDCGSFWV